MLNIEEMRNKARERGYWLHNKTADDKRYNFIKDNGIGLIVYPEKDEFEIYYNIDIFTHIKGDRCSSFMNDNHFKIFENRIERYANIIKSHYE